MGCKWPCMPLIKRERAGTWCSYVFSFIFKNVFLIHKDPALIRGKVAGEGKQQCWQENHWCTLLCFNQFKEGGSVLYASMNRRNTALFLILNILNEHLGSSVSCAGPHSMIQSSQSLSAVQFSLDGPRPTAMNLTDFRDNALLKLQVGGPFTGGVIDLTNQEYILIQVEQTEPPGQRRRRTQQVGASLLSAGVKGWGATLKLISLVFLKTGDP